MGISVSWRTKAGGWLRRRYRAQTAVSLTIGALGQSTVDEVGERLIRAAFFWFRIISIVSDQTFSLS